MKLWLCCMLLWISTHRMMSQLSSTTTTVHLHIRDDVTTPTEENGIEYDPTSFPKKSENDGDIFYPLSTSLPRDMEATAMGSNGVTFSSRSPPPETSQQSKTSNSCPVIGMKQVAGTFIKCKCQQNEVLVDGKCQYFPGVMKIPILIDNFYFEEGNLSDFDVIIRDVECDQSKYTYHEFTKGQFNVRPRGDVVLKDTSVLLNGQRINNYCLMYHLDDKGDLTWFMKSCVPIPAIPRCCHYGYAMKEGSCQPAKTPEILMPDIAAMPFGKSIKWSNVTNYLSSVTCTTYPYTTIPLNYKQSNLVNLANGVQNGWVPKVIDKRRLYYDCPRYCVDGIEKKDKSVEYFTTFCYSDPSDRHKELCGDKPCLRKCCDYGYSLDTNRFSCVKDSNSTFDPPTHGDKANYVIVIGWPPCSTPITKAKETISIDKQGILVLKKRNLPSSYYCVETFINNEHREQDALTCLTMKSRWLDDRLIVFPICNSVSLLFLFITIACYLQVPELQKNGGVHHMYHAIALSTANLSTFTVHVFPIKSKIVCILVGIMMQFGFLTTFFWLNIICFENWRTIRKSGLLHSQHSLSYEMYPIWYYFMYAWGIPTCICTLTVAMQYLAPKNIPGVIKPYIGASRCWFKEELALFVYFYGPIAILFISNAVFLFLIYYNYKPQLLHKKDQRVLKEQGSGENRKFDLVQDFKQRFRLFLLMVLCWVTEILSWKIPPIELWILTDILNSLQGLFVFIILLLNRNKRNRLEERYPCPIKMMNSFASSIFKCLSVSTSNSTSSSPSSEIVKFESHNGSENGIITISLKSLREPYDSAC